MVSEYWYLFASLEPFLLAIEMENHSLTSEPPSAAASSARVSDAEQRHHVECAEPAAAQLLELSLPLSPKPANQLRVVMYPTICRVLPDIHFHTR